MRLYDDPRIEDKVVFLRHLFPQIPDRPLVEGINKNAVRRVLIEHDVSERAIEEAMKGLRQHNSFGL